MVTRFVRGLTVPFTALLAAVAASPAAASFGPIFDLAPQGSGAESDFGEVAVDADGDAVFTWSSVDHHLDGWRIRTQRHRAGGVPSTVRTLSGSGQRAAKPDVAVDLAGDAVFVWLRFDGANWRVQARTQSATGVLSPVQTLSERGQDASNFDTLGPEVAVDADGDAVFAWTRFDGANWRVQTRALSTVGVLSPVQTLSDPGLDARDPQVALDADGDAVFSWWKLGDVAQARARSAAGVLSEVQRLSRLGDSVTFPPDVGVDADGDAIFTWSQGSFPSPSWVLARARSADGVLGPRQRVSPAGQGGFRQDVAVEPDGDAVFTWERASGLKARTRSASGVFGAVQTVSGGHLPQVGVDADGDAVFAFDFGDGLGARTRTAAGVLGPFQPLSSGVPPGCEGEMQDFRLAVGAGGDAAVVWTFLETCEDEDRWVQGTVGP